MPVRLGWGLGLYRGYIGVMENKMETTTGGYIGVLQGCMGLYRGYTAI